MSGCLPLYLFLFMGDMVMGMFQKNHGKNLKVLQLLALPALAALAVTGMSQSSQAALVASDSAANYTSSEWTGSNTAYD